MKTIKLLVWLQDFCEEITYMYFFFFNEFPRVWARPGGQSLENGKKKQKNRIFFFFFQVSGGRI